MNVSGIKNISRKLFPVLSNGLYMVLPSMVNQLLAFLVIRISGVESWGQVVSYQLFYYIASNISGWGNKEALMVKYASETSFVSVNWGSSLITRALILLTPLLLFTVFLYPIHVAWHICTWIFLRFFTQSSESLVVYHRKYKVAVCSELAALLPLLVIFIYHNDVSTQLILTVLTLTHLVRFIVMIPIATVWLKKASYKINPRELSRTFPFLLITFSALLMTKADLYCFDVLTNPETVGKYQVINGFMSLISAAPSLVFAPYLIKIYQMDDESRAALQKKLTLIGMAFSIASCAVVYFIIKFIYRFNFGIDVYVLLSVFSFIPFLYQLNVQMMYKAGRQLFVLIMAFSGILINILTCLWLIPELGISGAILSSCIALLFWLLIYKSGHKKRAAFADNPSA